MNSSDKKQSLIYGIYAGYAAFFILLLFSVIFYPERTCFSDSAFQGFFIVNTKSVSIPLDRFGSVLVQVVPALLVNLDVPLKYVLIGFSASFVLQNLILFLLLHKLLRQYEPALILALYNVLMVTETFYLPTSEVKQGFSLTIFASGLALALPIGNFSGIKKAFVLLLYTAILVTAIFLHPFVIAAVLFFTGYLALHKNRNFRISAGWILLIALAGATLKFIIFHANDYDALMYGRSKNFIIFFPDYLALPGFGRFLDYCRSDWYLYAVMLLAVSLFYLRKRLFLKLFWLLGFTVGCLLLIIVSFAEEPPKFYIESFYLALGIFALYPFVTELLPHVKVKHAVAMLALIFALRLNAIYHAHSFFTARLSWIRDMLREQPGKFIIRDDLASVDFLKAQWAVAFESLMFSSIAAPDSARSFIILSDTNYYAELDSSGGYIYTPMRAIPYDKLNPHYFRPKPER